MNYSEEEVAKHNSEESCWIVINGKVLDVTRWLKRHPGGKSVLLELGGRDASFDFTSVGHSGGAWKEMSKYEIGVIGASGGDGKRRSAL
mmetsp:Transcript_47319/g.118392  ORF Transcript_47319/g.118392 Transcript_47319/m.118392 type:complete len:89 (-) Transcript_47319:351-617(-)